MLLNVGLAALWSLFIFIHTRAFLETGELTLLAIVALETMVVTMFLFRREASAANVSALALVATALGTFSTLLMAPIERSDVPTFVTIRSSSSGSRWRSSRSRR